MNFFFLRILKYAYNIGLVSCIFQNTDIKECIFSVYSEIWYKMKHKIPAYLKIWPNQSLRLGLPKREKGGQQGGSWLNPKRKGLAAG